MELESIVYSSDSVLAVCLDKLNGLSCGISEELLIGDSVSESLKDAELKLVLDSLTQMGVLSQSLED